MSERRHRLHASEVQPVLRCIDANLRRLLEAREDLDEAQILFRVHYRLKTYVINRPRYPAHGTFEDIAQYLNGTIISGGPP